MVCLFNYHGAVPPEYVRHINRIKEVYDVELKNIALNMLGQKEDSKQNLWPCNKT